MVRMDPAYCYAHLSNTGLGNMLFVWSKAVVFASLNDLRVLHPKWTQMKLGPILRGERSWRLYSGYFKRNRSPHRLAQYWIQYRYQKIFEPPVTCLGRTLENNCLYIFNQIPHWSDYFGAIRKYRDLVRDEIYRMLTTKCYQQVAAQQAPCIAVHVRRGDFRELRPDENFAKVGLVRTPLTYFVQLILNIRQLNGKQLPVTLFSDGEDHELDELLNLPNVQRAARMPDIVDLLLMSRSRLLITSAGSTFSYWSAFLSDAPVLLHPDHIHAPIRSETVNATYFEGGVSGAIETWPDLLVQNIRAISNLGVL